MQLIPEHREQYPKPFAALDWLIEKATVNIQETTSDLDYGRVEYTGLLFTGNLPHHMVTALRSLATLGYRHPKSVDTIINVSWETSDATAPFISHSIAISFGHYKSNQNRVKFTHNIYRYLDFDPRQNALEEAPKIAG